MDKIKSLIENTNLKSDEIVGKLTEAFRAGDGVGIMRGKFKKKTGYIKEIKTTYVIEMEDKKTIELLLGDFYAKD